MLSPAQWCSSVNWDVPLLCSTLIYAAAAAASLCLHHTYLSYMIDCYSAYIILLECCCNICTVVQHSYSNLLLISVNLGYLQIATCIFKVGFLDSFLLYRMLCHTTSSMYFIGTLSTTNHFHMWASPFPTYQQRYNSIHYIVVIIGHLKWNKTLDTQFMFQH